MMVRSNMPIEFLCGETTESHSFRYVRKIVLQADATNMVGGITSGAAKLSKTLVRVTLFGTNETFVSTTCAFQVVATKPVIDSIHDAGVWSRLYSPNLFSVFVALIASYAPWSQKKKAR